MRRSLPRLAVVLLSACHGSGPPPAPAAPPVVLEDSASDAGVTVAPSPAATELAADTHERWNVPVGDAPVRGVPEALVTLVQFSDFQCPYCGRVQAVLEQLRRAYGAKIRIVWKDFPMAFHSRAIPATSLAREAAVEKGPAAFWTLHDQLFADQPKLQDADLLRLARGAGLDPKRAQAALAGQAFQRELAADHELGRALGVNGIPQFYLNGRSLVGAQPYEAFAAIIDEEVTRAQALLARGVPAGELYATLTANGRTTSQEPAEPAPVAPTPSAVTVGKVTRVDSQVGQGRAAKAGDKISVHYTGAFPDGTVFDSSRQHGGPFDFTLGSGVVIKGWDLGVVGMKVGGRRTLTIPPDLGYGARGVPPKIPANATLVFDVELLSIQ